jgi:uncharacterized DUF497 family protein
MGGIDDLERCVGFQWDTGNAGKNWDKHRVADAESEEVFFNDPLVTGSDASHSQSEYRYFALGRTDAGRFLFISFTIRRDLIRVISARDMTNSELRRYLA